MPGRGNGLEASSYTPLTDLEPRLADAMLEALRDEGVAAYVVPATTGSAGLTMKEFRGPLERLWVDTAAKSRAQAVLEGRLPALRAELERHAEHDDEAAWAALVASFHASPDDPVPRWPVVEDVEEAEEDTASQRVEVRFLRQETEASADPSARLDDAGEDEDVAADDGDHFVPPPPPPLPQTDRVTKAAWLALLGGPLYLLLAVLLSLEVGGWGLFLAAAAFVGGFVTLVARMGDRPPTDSGPDDGAVV